MIYRLSIPALLFASVRANSEQEAIDLGQRIGSELSAIDFEVAGGPAARGKELQQRIETSLANAITHYTKGLNAEDTAASIARIAELIGALQHAQRDPAGYEPVVFTAPDPLDSMDVRIEDTSEETARTGKALWWHNLMTSWWPEDEKDETAIELIDGTTLTEEDAERYAIIESDSDRDVFVSFWSTREELREAVRSHDAGEDYIVDSVVDLETNEEIGYTTTTTVTLEGDDQ